MTLSAPGLFCSFVKKVPMHGLYPQDVEDLGGHPYAGDADDGILFSDQAVKERPQPEALVGGRVLRIVEVERDVGRHVVQAGLRRGRVQLHNPLRLLKRQRLQHQRIDRGEDRRRRADAKRQRDERGCGDALGLPQETEGMTQVRKRAGPYAEADIEALRPVGGSFLTITSCGWAVFRKRRGSSWQLPGRL